MAKRTLTNRDGYQAVLKALEAKGYKSPQSALASLLGFAGRQGVHNWGGKVPPMHAYKVSLLTGVPMEVINPETVAEVEKMKKEMQT